MMANKIIITEDNEETQKIARILKENGYEVEINPQYVVQEVCEQEKLLESIKYIKNKFKDTSVKTTEIKK